MDFSCWPLRQEGDSPLFLTSSARHAICGWPEPHAPLERDRTRLRVSFRAEFAGAPPTLASVEATASATSATCSAISAIFPSCSSTTCAFISPESGWTSRKIFAEVVLEATHVSAFAVPINYPEQKTLIQKRGVGNNKAVRWHDYKTKRLTTARGR